MSPTKKIVFSMMSLFIILVTIACSCGSFTPFGSDNNTQDEEQEQEQEQEQEVEATTERADTSSPDSPFIDHYTNEITILAGEGGTVVADCPSGSLLISGGFATGEGMHITKTMPGSEGWSVTGVNNTTRSLSLTAYAYCLHDSPGSVRVVREETLVSGYPKAQCESAELLTGGGYEHDPGSLSVYISTPNGSPSPDSWSVYAKNMSSSDQTIRVYAVCLSGGGLTGILVRDESVSYLPGTPSTGISMTCPEGAVMIAGGYEGVNTYMSRLSMENAGMWEIQTLEKYYLDGSLDHAVCLYLP